MVEHAFEFGNSGFNLSLLVTGRIPVSVFGKVTEGTCFRQFALDFLTDDMDKIIIFIFQFLKTFFGYIDFAISHIVTSNQRSLF
jgi:hypothetical protein